MHARVLPAAVAVALALTACNGEGEAAPTLPPVTADATPTPTATATTTAEAVPTQATAQTPQGAEQFVRYFYDQLERAYATRDPNLVRGLVTEDCQACTGIIDSVTRLRAQDVTVANYDVTVLQTAVPSTDGVPTTVTTVLAFTEYVERAPDGTEKVREPAVSRFVQDVLLAPTPTGWRVTALVNS